MTLEEIQQQFLLVDTGATYTMLSREVLLSLGLDPSAAITRRSLMTANGLLVLPEVEVDELHTLGQRVTLFPVLAHNDDAVSSCFSRGNSGSADPRSVP